MLDERFACCQRHDHWNTPIHPGYGNRCVMQNGLYECRHLRNKAFAIAFDEKMQWQVTPYPLSITDDSGVRIIIFCTNSTGAAQQFHPLVISIDSLAAVADCSNDTVGKPQHDDRVIDVSRFRDSRTIHGVRQHKDLLYFAPDEEAGH